MSRSKEPGFQKTLVASAVASALAVFGSAAHAQQRDTAPQDTAPQGAASQDATSQDTAPEGDTTEDITQLDTITVTGVRASLERAMDIKRDSHGVVDAITAEDIGKFPDTNLAESLQRISGVSIDRVNGEGSEVTVRGFGPGFNLVTLNGRQMPTANVSVIGGDQDAAFKAGDTRAFDFSNLASEGVTGLEVYKTGRAAVPSGGIGATVNINTFRPLANPGLTLTFGAKALHDASVESSGDEVTPEVSGLIGWTNPDETFGVSFFGSFQRRDSASPSATVNGWNIRTFDQFLDPNNGFVYADGRTNIENAPTDGGQLVSVPSDSRYHLSEIERERVNGHLTLQFRPSDTLTLTADAFFARNQLEEQRLDQTNWFNRPFNNVRFDANPVVATTVFLQEDIAGVKDAGFEQQFYATEDTLKSFGFNAEWEATDRLRLRFDAHTSEAESLPDAPTGASAILVSMGAPVISAHSLDIGSGFPQQSIVIDDSLRGNGNGILDAGDLGSQVARTITSSQNNEVDQVRLDGTWEFDNGSIDAGIDYRNSEQTQARVQTQQILGDWGITNVGDIPADLVRTFCLTCLFDDFDPGSSGDSLTAFQANAADLYRILSSQYAAQGNPINTTQNDFNRLKERIWSAYFQFRWEGELGGFPAELVTGARFERTEVEAVSDVAQPLAISPGAVPGLIWQADNDFTVASAPPGGPVVAIVGENSFTHLLPSMDFSIEFRDDLKSRFSFSQTIARPAFGDMFSAVSIDTPTPPRPTALGGVPTGNTGNPQLEPLKSDNFDLSLEWYFGDASYVSIGFFDKRVKNFVGSGVTSQSLLELRDPSSGQPGTRSGQAVDALADIGATQSDVNLFTMTALIDNPDQFPDPVATFQANQDADGNLDQAFVDQILAQFDIEARPEDPLAQFAVNTPLNNEEAKIHGFEVAGLHFFGDSGFGIQANYTHVSGDIGFNDGADPSLNQFALLGLSDTANATLIYEKYGISARLAYNWREGFLADTNRGADRNPVYVDSYRQWDVSLSYALTDQWTFTFEGINLTQESIRTFGRDRTNLWFAQELDRRFLLGVRYTF